MITTHFSVWRGLNTSAHPEGLLYDGRSGTCELALAVDVDILDNGRRVRCRPGRVLVDSRDWRDGYNAPDGQAYAVVDGVICEVLEDLSVRPLAALQSPGPVAWAALGDIVFWSNGVESGLIQWGEAGEWGGRRFPVASEAARYVDPAAGQVLGAAFGRVWIGRDDVLHYTAGAWNFEKAGASGIMLPARITMIRPVDDGLYVGTEAAVFFLAGANPAAGMPVRRVSIDPAIPGSDVLVRADDYGRFDPVTGVIWTGPRGICLGLPDGIVINLTKNRVALDAPASGAAAVALPLRYVAILHP